MDINERVKCLHRIDLFKSFSDQEKLQFAENLSEVRLEPGEVLFYEGAPENDMYILIDGTLKVFKNSRTITYTSAIDYTGEMAIIEQKPRSATIEAHDNCRLLKITSEQFNDYLSRQPASLVTLMKSLSRKIRRDTESMSEDFEKANILIHDMKNLLTPFLYLDLIKKSIPDDPNHKYIEIMIEAKKNLAELIQEAMSNAKKLKMPYTIVPNSLQDLLSEMEKSEFSIHPDIKDRMVKITIPEDLPKFPFNKLDLRRVLDNLVLNACQASKKGDTMEVEVACEDKNIVMRVRDYGSGIPPRISSKVFQAHFTTKEEGNGLGLTSCKQVIEERHGGTINFISTPGKETIFTVTLPQENNCTT